jgi:hypothetical protein
MTFNTIELKKLYRSLEKDNNRLKKKQARQEQIIKTNIIERNKINSQIKRNTESVQKSFYPSTNKISLLYKKQGEFYYVKARFYWGGKQREVQVGSIPNVIEIINAMIVNKLLSSIKIIKVKKLTWGQINKRPILIDAIKEIASLKAQEYILKRLIYGKVNIKDEIDTNIRLNYEEISHFNAKHEPVYEEEDLSEEGIEWYKKWRRDNL